MIKQRRTTSVISLIDFNIQRCSGVATCPKRFANAAFSSKIVYVHIRLLRWCKSLGCIVFKVWNPCISRINSSWCCLQFKVTGLGLATLPINSKRIRRRAGMNPGLLGPHPKSRGIGTNGGTFSSSNSPRFLTKAGEIWMWYTLATHYGSDFMFQSPWAIGARKGLYVSFLPYMMFDHGGNMFRESAYSLDGALC